MEMVIFIGIQATGKSEFYKRNFYRTHIRLNLDMLKTRHRENIILNACIEAKQPLVVDNTNLTIEQRVKYIELAKKNRFKVTGYYFQSKVADALVRNSERSEKELVPEVAILGAFKKMQLPSVSEGFDSLLYVRIDENNEFIIEEFVDEV